jgi:hypothetical protein
MEERMDCPNCGQENLGNLTSCGKCGFTLSKHASTLGQAKSKMAAGLLGIFFGGVGVHRFYLGYKRMGIIQIIVFCCTCGVSSLWGCIEGILILAGIIDKDAQGRPLRK